MYNKDIKERYIKECANHRNDYIEGFLRKKFAQSEMFERRYDRDICCFNMEEIMEYYKSLCTTSFYALNVVNSQMGLYTNWCLSQNYVPDNQNHFLEMSTNLILSCLNKGLADKKVVTREELLHICEDLPNVSDRLLIYAIYLGVCGENYKDLVNLNSSRIKHDPVKVDYILKLEDGTELMVDSYFADLVAESEKEYKKYDENGEELLRLSYSLEDDEAIKVTSNVRNVEEAKIKGRRFYVRLLNARDYLNEPVIDKQALKESGRVDMIRRYAEQDDISYKEALDKYKTEIESRYGKIQNYTGYIKRYFGEG